MAMHGAAGPSKGKVKLREEWRWHSYAPNGIGTLRKATEVHIGASLSSGNE